MPSTRSRPGGREHARPSSGGTAAEHATKIYWTAGAAAVVIIAFLSLTSTGHMIDAATQHFMLFYAGVFALIALCASVGLGLVATDRRFLGPGQRVVIQSAHRAASFGAVAFLVIHIITEILAQRVHVIDAVIPFLSPFRTFYLGLGTIAADLVILLVITGILRGRFNSSGKAWRWRAIHYTSYASLVFGVWHGLLAGRPAKPYVDWSYGLIVALVFLGVAVRVLARAQKPKESLSTPPVPENASSASAPLRAAAMAAVLTASRGGLLSGRGPATGGQPVLSPPLGAPVITATALPAGDSPAGPVQQPYYEPGYDGPPRYLGAPRPATGPLPAVSGTGPLPRVATGPVPHFTGPLPTAGSGPLPPHPSGPLPRMTGPLPQVGPGPRPRPATGPLPRAETGPLPRVATGPVPRGATGPVPRAATGPVPRVATGPVRPADPREQSWPTGPVPTGPVPRVPTGSFRAVDPYEPSWPTGPVPRAAARPQPWPAEPSPVDWNDTRWDSGGWNGASHLENGYPGPGHPSGPYQRQAGLWDGDAWPGQHSWQDAGGDRGGYPAESPWDGGFPETDPALRYREPGPGMPGYRVSREHRYGGDKR